MIDSVQSLINKCICCGSKELNYNQVLWLALIRDWQLSQFEIDYINRQQGVICQNCQVNLRTMALAFAIMKTFHFSGVFKDFVRSFRARRLNILEINEAGSLTQYLRKLPKHVIKHYPQIDMMDIMYDEKKFDLVIHSDTLEHVLDPKKALKECYRILKPGGYCIFTVPIILGRLSMSRENKPISYHGNPNFPLDDFIVHTEFGADIWSYVMQSGFSECRIITIEYPAAQAIVGVK